MGSLSSERWRALSPHLDRALDMAPAECESWLEALEREDAALARDLRALLALDPAVEKEGFLEAGAPAGGLRPAALPSQVGRTLGAYTLESPLGEGGMGSVWLAHRSDGSYEGKVAVKLVRPGLDSKSVLSRFESERHTLALMDHPNIARVFDAGTAPDGRPFFVMEYVAGRPLTDYCQEHRLSVRDRLELFLDVCAGVQHAHRNGIIHRDLKPSNILVSEHDGRPIPKLIDFGIAKATGDRITDTSRVTLDGERIGTPAYMSPEQWRIPSSRVDTRADIYALGVVLYELLVGALPREPSSPAALGAADGAQLFSDDTPRPTVRFASLGEERAKIATGRRTDPSSLERMLAGDLSWVVMKAIEREPDHRYETVAAFSGDIRAHLNDEPVQAGPPNVRYRARKFIRRHRVGASAVVAVTAALIAGIVIAGVGYARALRAERGAASERDKAAAINAFLLETFSSADPFAGGGRKTTIVEALAEATKRLETSLARQPETRAAVLDTIGRTYFQLGQFAEAEPLLRKAVEIRRTLGPTGEGDLAASLGALGFNEDALSHDPKGRKLLEEALAIQRRLFPGGSVAMAETLSNLASISNQSGDRPGARHLYDEAIEICDRLLGPDENRTLALRTTLAEALRSEGDLNAAVAILRDVVERQRQVLAPQDSNRAEALERLGAVLDDMSQIEEAERVTREALGIRRKTLGPLHPATCDALMSLAWVVRRRGRLDEAETLLREAIENNRVGGGVAMLRATYLNDLGSLLVDRGDLTGALASFEESLAIYRRDGGPNHPYVATALVNLALLKSDHGAPREAEALEREALRIRLEVFGERSADVASTREALASTLRRQNRWKEALDQATQALSVYGATLGSENEATLRCRANRAMCLWKAGQPGESEKELLVVRSVATERYGRQNEAAVMAAGYLASLYRATGRPGEAEKLSGRAGR